MKTSVSKIGKGCCATRFLRSLRSATRFYSDSAMITGEHGGYPRTSRKNQKIATSSLRDDPVKVTVVGPRPIAGDVIGGTKVSFEDLVTQLRACTRLRIEIINTSRPFKNRKGFARHWINLHVLVSVLWQLWRATKNSHIVMWNVSPGGAMRAAFLMRGICRLRHCCFIVRLFGGDLDGHYERISPVGRWIADASLFNSDLILLQTRHLVTRFANRTWVEWYPTTRDMPSRNRPLPAECRRLLFVGQLRPEKGIRELLKASLRLTDQIKVTIVGPVMAGFDISEIGEEHSNITYLGVVSPESIAEIIEAHDALLFPSYYKGEGYPGVIVEALQMGLPVIATEWKALPELVMHEQSGLLIPPHNEDALFKAIQRLISDSEFFLSLQRGAQARGDVFRPAHAIENLNFWINKLVRRY